MTPHNQARPGDYAEAVLLPGDPLRARWIAETFLEDAREVNAVRNCLGFTGTWNGVPVSVQATGMGQPSTAIYVHELITVYGAKTLIRVGTCGGLNTDVKVRDVVIGASASTDSTIVKDAFGNYNYAPAADFGLLRAADDAARAKGKTVHVGGILSSDIFYHPSGLEAYGALIAHGVLGVEMEAATLYMLAARFKVRALAICTMTDCLITGDEIDATARQTSLRDMVEIALSVATA
ncbi:purine-nucleoside phosphorylase [Pelagibacterium lacus]|uniref:Purine nucleoside phosphorylase DeoD-type n=1 Tax=Pelagibacterium lacus TaxID=2282655 RepID=A0A369W8V9_9HYPH|nr:purine-nucleoside phosphorylase [Pelagibacterium lacus]RDE08501.1 purine-nucleoside phosphorylase [Pelagibacterium lacus]